MAWWKIILIVVGTALAAFVAYVILCLLAMIISSLFFDHKKTYSKDSKYYRFVFNSATGMVLFFMRIKIQMRGFDKIPDGRFLLVGNHISNWDPIVQWFALRKIENMAYISKPSNINIPFFGWTSLKLCFMPIDRSSARKSLEVFEHAAKLLKNDVVSVGVYPEGTRSKTGKLGKFHSAVFKIAQWAEVPVIVVKTTGTNKQKANFPFKKTVVKLEVVGVFDKEEVLAKKTNELSDKAYEMLL